MTSITPVSRTYISQRSRLHYVEWGDDRKPPLMLIHGGLDHCRSWDWIATELTQDWFVICPDLRGHGDSDWSSDGDYSRVTYVYDLAQLIKQKQLAPLTMMAHSMGSMVAMTYISAFPESVQQYVSIEGIGFSPFNIKAHDAKPINENIRAWIEEKQELASRQAKRYVTIEEAFNRMKSENKYLTDEQALHLTQHGTSQNEDGTYSWKFDNYLRAMPPLRLEEAQYVQLFANIECPVSIHWGTESFLPVPDASSAAFNALERKELHIYEQAGHWLHHARRHQFMANVTQFFNRNAGV